MRKRTRNELRGSTDPAAPGWQLWTDPELVRRVADGGSDADLAHAELARRLITVVEGLTEAATRAGRLLVWLVAAVAVLTVVVLVTAL